MRISLYYVRKVIIRTAILLLSFLDFKAGRKSTEVVGSSGRMIDDMVELFTFKYYLTITNYFQKMYQNYPKSMFHDITISIIQTVRSDQISHSVMSDSLRPHESQHARPLCPSPTPEFTLTHVHRVSDAIQPSHPLSSPSPPASNPSQHQSLFQ